MSDKAKLEIEFPVNYDPNSQMIFDDDGNVIANVRGWGRLNDVDKQDQIGRFMADSMNEKFELGRKGEGK